MKDAPFNEDREISTFRAELRRRLIAAREALAPAEHAAASREIHARLQTLLAPLPLTVIGICWPFRAEFDARPLATQLAARGVRAALPVVVDTDAPLLFREWTARSAMITDRYGICIPERGAALHPELILMPVNAFDAAGFRLGYGGGYFDRSLAALAPRPLAIGVGFEVARVASIRPQAHDVPMDAIVTEAGIFVPQKDGLQAADAADAAARLAAQARNMR